MKLAQVLVEVDEEQIKAQIEQLIREKARPHLLFMDITEMAKLTSLKKEYLEKHILHDPRIKQFERRHGKGKRLWLYEQGLEALRQIIDEWD